MFDSSHGLDVTIIALRGAVLEALRPPARLSLSAQIVRVLLTWGPAIFGLVAAALWVFASFQKVDFDPEERDEDGLKAAATTEKQGRRTIDILKTAKRQTRWNKWAALASVIAAIAAVCQIFLLH